MGGARHWRRHVSICPMTDCPLWTVRPLASRNVPVWLLCHDAAHLPVGWRSLSDAEALAQIGPEDAVLTPATAHNSEQSGTDGVLAHELSPNPDGTPDDQLGLPFRACGPKGTLQ